MDNYVVFDLETTGLSTKDAEIIEVSAIKVENNEVVDEYSTLLKPVNPISARSTAINGITNEMVSNSPKIEDILGEFLSFIDGYPLVGYNSSSYDLPILNRYVNELYGSCIENDHTDALYLARKKLPFLPSRTLSAVAEYFCLNTEGAHRALADCRMTNICYQKLLELPDPETPAKKTTRKRHRVAHTQQTESLKELHDILQEITADGKLSESEIELLQDWLYCNEHLTGQYPFDSAKDMIDKVLEDGVISQDELADMMMLFEKLISPTDFCACSIEIESLSEKGICLSGEFEFGSKSEIADIITKLGGVIKNSISKKVDYLIVGDQGSDDWSCGNYGTKIKRAMELMEKGVPIQIIKEKDFLCFVQNQGGLP